MMQSCLASLTKEDTLTNVDKDEIRVDVDQGLQNLIENARMMESYFLKKRLEIGMLKPELLVKDDSNELRLELIRKDDLLKKNYEKINHWQSILSDVQPVAPAAGKSVMISVLTHDVAKKVLIHLILCCAAKPAGGNQAVNGPPMGHQGPLSQGPMSQGPHTPMTPMSQGPMTPTGGGRPNTPGSGRPQTPGSMGAPRMQGYSPSMHQQSIGSPQLGPGPGMGGGLQGPLAYLEKSASGIGMGDNR